MTRATVTFLRTLALFTLMVVCSVSSAAADPMIVGVSGPSINMMYAFVTRDARLWQKHNSDPRVVIFEAGSVLAQAMLSGEVKMSISSGPAVIASRSQGAETIIVAAFVNTLPYSLVSAKAITKWDQLKGKRIAISRFGSGTDTAIRLTLRKFGLDPVKDITILQLGSQPDRIMALAAGSIEATLVSPPLDLTAKKQGYNILFNLADLGIAYPQQVIETTDRFIRENPQGIKNFLKGYIEGIRYAAKHKDETKKLIAKYLKVTDAELLEATYQSYLQVTDYSGYARLDGVQNAMDEVGQRVAVVKTKKPEDFVNTRFLKELEKEGFLKKSQK
ncbi:MAG: ABC transporter substrate-binding protein [Deltaproteobacteria bacterium]|nr:ABC transporter substrate-binding protein [Deltaproteobacteria bacterium]MBI2181730.1 ABC transporter substrate-binding protein [Deltaproteobacteria bacterium]MBI2227492.1 ABC transporter substrate-binding protein [Deltaproteobacteria bacterium]